MSKIPTAEEFLRENRNAFTKDDLIEFAKLHVEAALNSAVCEGEIDFEEYGGGIEGGSINYESIIKSYPLKNIK